MSTNCTKNEQSLDAGNLLAEYLDKTTTIDQSRVDCCNSSRSFYCPMCCSVLLPSEEWPDVIRNGKLRLPFDIDIVLGKKERRTCATGIQVVAISSVLDSTRKHNHSETSVEPDATSFNQFRRRQNCETNDSEEAASPFCGSAYLYSFEEDNMPSYDLKNLQNTYVLYPDEGSVPISSVGRIDRLIVLDMKWSRKSGKTDARFGSIPRVHLGSPPPNSHFWRWHSEGKGMLSTIEAIYFAAMEATLDWSKEERESLIHIMWLFALQHSVIGKRSQEEKRTVPFSEEGKSHRRELRQQHQDHPSKRHTNLQTG